MSSRSTKTLNWACCNLKNEDKYVLCDKCKNAFHIKCIDGGSSLNLTNGWKCSTCNTAKPNQRNDDLSVRRPQLQTSSNTNIAAIRSKKSSPTDQVEYTTDKDKEDIIREIVRSENGHMISELKQFMSQMLNTELNTIKKELIDVKESMAFMNKNYEDFISEHKKNSLVIKELQLKNEKLNQEVNDLQTRVNHMEQFSRQSNLEIQGVPEKRNEDLNGIIKKIGETVGYTIEDESIIKCTRVAKMNKESNRSRSIILQLSTQKVRDTFLAATITFNKANSSNKLNSDLIGFTGNKMPIFVSEHLSSQNKTLHAAARAKAKELGFKFVWVRNGRIYMRKNENADYKLIKNMDFLNKLE